MTNLFGLAIDYEGMILLFLMMVVVFCLGWTGGVVWMIRDELFKKKDKEKVLGNEQE